MAGGGYLIIAFFFGLAGGIVGRVKGGSFVIWFVISFLIPVFGLLAAIFMRNEATEPRRACPGCGKVVPAHDALCTRCGSELYLPPDDELLPSKFAEKVQGG
ncbi:MAG: hypothetical protein WCK97_03115 [Actinomycetes bacterium]|jgi:hypothetical protein